MWCFHKCNVTEMSRYARSCPCLESSHDHLWLRSTLCSIPSFLPPYSMLAAHLFLSQLIIFVSLNTPSSNNFSPDYCVTPSTIFQRSPLPSPSDLDPHWIDSGPCICPAISMRRLFTSALSPQTLPEPLHHNPAKSLIYKSISTLYTTRQPALFPTCTLRFD